MEGDRIAAVQTDAGALRGDAYLVALGSSSPALQRPLGLRLPIYPVKGYSITLPVADAGRAPVSTLLHESYTIANIRLGARIHAGRMAELSGFNRAPQIVSGCGRERMCQSV